MGIFRSIYRYVVTLGGLIESDISGKTDDMLSTPSGIKATFSKTRGQWTRQYGEVREAVAQLMMVLDQKSRRVAQLREEAEATQAKLKGAVAKFKETDEPHYRQAFTELFERDKAITAEQQGLSDEIVELRNKVESYKTKLREMQTRISGLKKQESEAIADIVSSQQIIKLNDSLNELTTDLDDQNVRAIEDRRLKLLSQAKLSGELTEGELKPDLDKELLEAGRKSEVDDVFAAMLAETEASAPEAEEEEGERQREI
ncbi:MAG: hypothetical protein HN742_07935 [Lentisphaerae bacterium]|jgi:phage shock protein A|nr:hypothetical protein [Lentisphaerota bacterium]MBT4817881.1 hypothetical protein [Lentisphaerota bacterium]MBT5604728.1 hypothetical protein [Lentisphaerota bacterium]MBT7058098.1 hypothetical protein [Lentisphaerota bacterium]MBT7841786.1 hypothetical protein [Lentisphaerota bacterium]